MSACTTLRCAGAAPVVSARHNVRSIPTLILFAGGAEWARLSGAVSAAQRVAGIPQHLRQGAA